MRRKSNASPLCTLSLLILLPAALSVGCGVDDQGPPVVPGEHPGTEQPGSTDPNGSQPKGELLPPSLDQTPSTVCSETIGIRGSAAPGTSVFAHGGRATSGIATDANPTTGRFCLPIPLKLDDENKIEVYVQDTNGAVSKAVERTIRHTSDTSACADSTQRPPSTPAGDAEPDNIALGASGDSEPTPDKGNNDFLTDGKSDTVAIFEGGDFYWPWGDLNGWVSIPLEKPTQLSKVVVRWRDKEGDEDEYYGEEYKLLVSKLSDPGKPNIDNGKWKILEEVTDGDGGEDSFDLSNYNEHVRHVALWLQQDGTYKVLGWTEVFAIAEIEVWDVPKQTSGPTATASNTCAAGSGS